MPKSPKAERPATGGKQRSRHQNRSSKAGSSAVSPDRIIASSGLPSPQLTTGSLAHHGKDAHEHLDAPSGQTLKAKTDDQCSRGATTAVTESGLCSPDEPSAIANRPNDPEPEVSAPEKAKGGDNLALPAPRTEAQKAPAPVQGSQCLSSTAEQHKRSTPDTVTTVLPQGRSVEEAAGSSAKPQIRAQGPGTYTTSPSLITPGSSSATSPGSRNEDIPSQGVKVERPQQPIAHSNAAQVGAVRARSGTMSGTMASATSGDAFALESVAADGKAKEQRARRNTLPPATNATREGAIMPKAVPVKLCEIRKDKTYKKTVAMVVAVAVAAAGIIALALFASPHRHLLDKGYCTLEECAFHASMLTARLDKSIDPCEDFSAYVCSSWLRSGDYSEFVKTPVDGMLFSRFASFRKMLYEGTKKIPAGERARAMYDVCMSTGVKNKGNIQSFLRLMEAVGLSWPEQPAGNESALGVSLSLAYKWQLPLWVSLEVPIWRKSAKWRLLIKPGDHVPLLWNQYHSVRSGGAYLEYWHGFYTVFRTNLTSPLNKTSIEKIADTEGDILRRLQKSYASRMKNPAVVPLASIGNFSAPLTTSAWLEQLNMKLELRPPMLADHEVITSDTGFLGTFGALFSSYTNEQLLRQLSWTFIQFCAPAIDRELHPVRFGDTWKASVYKPIFCAFRVEWIFKMLVFALDYVSRLTEEDQLIVDDGYSSLISALAAMLYSSTWLDEKSKEVAADKVASIQALLWPSPQWLNNEILDVFYSEYPTKEETFDDFWINTRFIMSRRNRTDDFELARGLPKNVPPANFKYDYVRNNVEIPIGIVNRPLYYRRGTKAMFYGGLGFQMALEIVSALDSIGIHWTKDGQKVTSILSPASMKIFDTKDSCLKEEGIETIFPEIPALEIAYSAMKHAIESDKDSQQVKDLPEEKVFFMTICYMSCTSSTAHSVLGADCNKIARNSPVFHKAFNCPSDSKMNPTKKCHFLD